MKNKLSIYDIAKYSEVSPASVSYVINGKNKATFEFVEILLFACKTIPFSTFELYFVNNLAFVVNDVNVAFVKE